MTRLTDIAIRNLKPKAYRYEVSDPGARGLRVCVSLRAAKNLMLFVIALVVHTGS
jgi:hypothetical protein